jgi:hypothetical protein
MHSMPIIGASACEDAIDALARNLLAVDVTEPGACQPEARLAQALDNID